MAGKAPLFCICCVRQAQALLGAAWARVVQVCMAGIDVPRAQTERVLLKEERIAQTWSGANAPRPGGGRTAAEEAHPHPAARPEAEGHLPQPSLQYVETPTGMRSP